MRAGDLVDHPRHRRAPHELAAGPQVADRLPDDDPDRAAMRIAPRTLLCGQRWRVGGSVADTGFDELRDLCDYRGRSKCRWRSA